MSLKTRTLFIALVSSLALTVVKLVVGLLSSSIAVLASALDSFTDTCSMGINLIAVRSAEKPADKKHQFGHGKAEAIAGLFQAVFIGVSAGYLIVQAIHRMVDGYVLQDESVAIVIVVVALVVSMFLARRMKRVGECTSSPALQAGSLNYGADVWTNAGVLVALALEKLVGVKNADPVVSVLISIYIIVCALRIGRDTVSQLMDRSLPEDLIAIIDRCIRAHAPLVKGYHRLRTRSVGLEKEIELHLEVDRGASFEEAHLVSEAIIADIKREIPGAYVTIHNDPV